MSVLPDISVVVNTARAVVLQAKRDDKLDALTNRLVRQEVETRLGIAPGVLDTGEFKKAVKVAVEEAVNDDAEEEPPAESPPRKAIKKRKSKADEGAAKVSKKSKKDAPAAEEDHASKKDEDVEKKPPPKKRKSKAGDESAKAPKKAKKEAPVAERSSSKVTKSSPSETARKGKGKAFKSSETVVSSGDEADDASPKRAPGSPSTSKKPAPAADADAGDKSDSEMSVLIDEPPKRARKKKGEAKDKEKKPTRPRKSTPALSKDEETIKRLKALVFACGVRKPWAREFASSPALSTPAQQIAHLRGILKGLGMGGRLSMEKARRIREGRELARELEDVKNFEKAVTGQGSRGRRGEEDEESGGKDGDEDGDEEEGEDEAVARKRRNTNARKSIMAFLGDESEDE
ncbi:hypothetical protein PLICRDRAFT_44392 [Plicaturopsis crispa FD-325 SS-3]|nr:hypothetical protein PLICRDRAFT_44392 [Plicaturopsis crispa FD-325 SS-3]